MENENIVEKIDSCKTLNVLYGWKVRMCLNESKNVEGVLIKENGYQLWKNVYPRRFRFTAYINKEPKSVSCEDADKIPEEVR